MEKQSRKPTAWEMYRAEKERLECENARLREALAGLLDGVYGGPPVEEIGGIVMRHGRHRIETVDFARSALAYTPS